MLAAIATSCEVVASGSGHIDRGTHGAFLAAGALAVPLTVVFGRWTDKLLRARLQASR